MLRIENIASNIRINEEKQSDNRSIFSIEPLYRGYGNTIGNALRRVLLSSVPGCAIKGVKIEGVANEFSVKEGVKENILEILLNLKSVFIKSSISGDRNVRISVKGPKVITASDIEHDNSLEIVNSDALIANVTGNVTFDAEIIVGTGEGFVFSEDQDRSNWPEGFIPIDSIFTPIKKVSYRVEETIFGGLTNYDKLIIDLETDGSASAKDVIGYSSEMLIDHFTPFLDIGNNLKHIREEEKVIENVEPQEVDEKRFPDLKLEDLDFSVRSFNCLKKAGLENLSDLASLSKKELLEIKNLGKSSLNEIIKKLEEFDINIDG